MGIEKYRKMQIEELYEVARKIGVKHDDTIEKDELINRIVGFEKESETNEPESNIYSVKNKKKLLSREQMVKRRNIAIGKLK